MAELADSLAARTTDAKAYLAGFDEAMENPELEDRYEFELEASRRSFERYTAPVRDAGGALVGRIFTLRETTREREVERLKAEFVATVSHELRTPLTSILGYVRLLLRGRAGEISGEHRELLEVAERNAERLVALVGDLLFVAHADAARLTLELEPFDVGAVAAESVEAMMPLAGARGIDLSADVQDAPVKGDRRRICQLLDNLVANALKFTPARGRVQVRVYRAEGCAVLEVEDSGFGIPWAEQAHLFDRFYRGRSATTREIQGSGLGLSIARTIAELHGGAIAVQSVEGAGTTFRVELPLRADAADAAEAA